MLNQIDNHFILLNMKRKLLFTFLIASSNFLAYSQFTPGNLVVVRVGDGSTAIAASTTTVSLLEYNTAGVLGTTVNLDAATAGARLTLNGSSGAEGLLKLSNNKDYLILGGYDAPVNNTTVVSTVGASSFTRLVARINALGQVDYSTKIYKIGTTTEDNPSATVAQKNTDYYSGNIKTVASVDGTGFWIGNSTNGIRYVPFGNLATTVPTVITASNTLPNPTPVTQTNAFTNMRAINIFDGKLFASLTNTTNYGMVQIGTGLPTSAGQTPVNLTGFQNANTAAGDFVFFDLDAGILGVDVAYTLEGAALKKHIFNGTTWSSSSSVGTGRINAITLTPGMGGSGYTTAPTVTISGGGGTGATATAIISVGGAVTGFTITNNGVGYSTAPTVAITDGGGTGAAATATIAAVSNGMTGILVADKPVLFYTSGANAGNNALIRLNDNNGYAAAIDPTVHSVIALSGANYVFRGVAFTPSTTTLPVNLKSFNGKNATNGVLLNWETASEENNDRFEILRSNSKDNFQVLSSVKGAGNSKEINKYSFLDTEPLSGVNYYKLNQIDFNGKSTPSNIVAVKTGLIENKVDLSASSSELKTTINSISSGVATLQVFDVSGHKVLNKTLQLQSGLNANVTNINNLENGLYVARLIIGSQVVSKKFVK